MEKMRDKNGKPEKKSSRTTLIMAAGLLGILLIGIAPMLKTDGAKKQFQQETVPSAEEYAAALESRLDTLEPRFNQQVEKAAAGAAARILREEIAKLIQG